MKKLTAALIIISVSTAAILSCTKTGVNAGSMPGAKNTGSIQGKWSLKNDSIAEGASQLTGTKYTGTSTDYFDFRADNKLYIKEGAKLDTFNYQLSNDSDIFISSPNTSKYGLASALNGFIKPISNSSATIRFSTALINPGIYYWRLVNLAR